MTKNNNKQNIWHLDSNDLNYDDALLGCLLILSKIEQRPTSAEILLAGLPRLEGKMTPSLFIRAAQKLKLTAKILKKPINSISSLNYPVVLLLAQQQACLLVGSKTDDQGQAHYLIILPESGNGIKQIKAEALEAIYSGYAIFVKAEYKFDRKQKLIQLDPDYKGHWFRQIINKTLPFYLDLIVASFILSIIALLTPLYTMNVYDRVVPNHALETLTVLSIGIFLAYVFDFAIKMLRQYVLDALGKKADLMLSAKIYEHLLAIKMAKRPDSVGAFASQIGGFESFREFVTSSSILVLIDLPFASLFLVTIYFLGGWQIMLVPLIAMPTIIIMSLLLARPIATATKAASKYANEKQSILIESLIGIETIKSLNAQGQIQYQWEHLCGEAAQASKRFNWWHFFNNNFAGFVTQLTSIAIIVLGVLAIIRQEITMGALIAINMLNYRILSPCSQIASLITKFQQAKIGYQHIDSMMQLDTEQQLEQVPLNQPWATGAMMFKDVSFTYPNQKTKILNNISFKVDPGEKIAILGRIGSGKTTINKLLMGIYQQDAGNILIDGIEIQQLDINQVRANIGYVAQDSMLFYGSVRDNITLGAPQASDHEILQAASIAGVTDFIIEQPVGFDLCVGERGEKLSGGQRQAITIARALLLQPNILLLDEPTNMMDQRSEDLFKMRIKPYLDRKTLILVTHKFSLLSLVQRIIILDQGKIIADGPRDEILKKFSTPQAN